MDKKCRGEAERQLVWSQRPRDNHQCGPDVAPRAKIKGRIHVAESWELEAVLGALAFGPRNRYTRQRIPGTTLR